MVLENSLQNKVWLTANNKETEFKRFCASNNLPEEDPQSLDIFKTEETVKERKRRAAFYSNGFFVCWKNSLRQKFRVFVKSKDYAAFIHSRLLLDTKLNSVVLYRVSKGQMNKVA